MMDHCIGYISLRLKKKFHTDVYHLYIHTHGQT